MGFKIPDIPSLRFAKPKTCLSLYAFIFFITFGQSENVFFSMAFSLPQALDATKRVGGCFSFSRFFDSD